MIFNSLNTNDSIALTLIMPVHNEGVRVIPAITTLAFTVKVPLQLLIVYDDNDDVTIQVVKEMITVFPNIVLLQNKYSRIIGAIKTGFEHNQSKIVGIWVSYHVDPYGLVNDMYELAHRGCQLVSGNRFNKLKRFSRGNPMKKLLSRGGNFILNRLIGMPLGDITTSLKLYTKDFIIENPIETVDSGGWALSSELAIKACIRGVRVGEVEFKPQNTSMINGISNFRVFAQLDQYLHWLRLGIKHRHVIRKNYANGKYFFKHI